MVGAGPENSPEIGAGVGAASDAAPVGFCVCALATGAGVGAEEFVGAGAVVVGLGVGAAEEFVGASVAATEGRGVGAAVGATTGTAVDAASQVMAIFWPSSQWSLTAHP